MIHLFNRVYLKADKGLKVQRDRIVISKEFGGLSSSEPTILHRVSDTVPINPIYTHKSYDELLRTEFGFDEKAFLSYLLHWDTEKRLTIYCDSENMLLMVTKYWKTLFPTWTPEFYVKMVYYALTYYLEIQATGHTLAGNLREGNAIDLYNQYHRLLADDYKPELIKLWSETNGWPASREQREYMVKRTSMELQFANVLLNPGWRHGQTFKDKLVRAVKKALIFEFCQNRRAMILKSLVNFSYLEPDTTFDIIKHSLYDLAVMHRDYRFLIDENFRPENVEHVYQYYDMDSLKRIHDKLWGHPFGFEIDWGPLIKNNLTYEDIINFELNSSSNHLVLRYGEFYESVNMYLFDDLFNALRQDRVEDFRLLRLS